MTEPIDLLIEPRWIIPIEPRGCVLEAHSVAVRDGRIVDVLPSGVARMRFAAKGTVSLPEHVVLPGLVNAHTHAAMTLLRGLHDDLPLMRWLQEAIWPAEARFVSPEFVYDGTLLACAEMLRGGVTCFSDMYFFPEAAARAATEAGMRCVVGIIAVDFPSAYASDADDYIAKGLATRDAWGGNPLVGFAMAPHAPYTVSDRTFGRVLMLAEQLDLPIHLHVHETRHEIDQSVKEHGMRPLERLRRLGIVGPSLIGVHGVYLSDDEIEMLARNACNIVHCPSSNMKLASGIAPIGQLNDAGVRISFGSDGAASNNRLDILQEVRQAALLSKVATGDASSLPAHDCLRMATLNGALALGLGALVGSISAGKLADLIAIDLGDWITTPCFDPASHVVYVAGREQVSHVWVCGQARVQEKALLHFSNSDLRRISKLWHNKLVT